MTHWNMIIGVYDMRRYDLGRKCADYIYKLGGAEPHIQFVTNDETSVTDDGGAILIPSELPGNRSFLILIKLICEI